MKKIEKLTKEQEQLMITVRNEWIGRCDSGKKIDKKKAKEFIEWLYVFSKLPKPQVYFFVSPLGLQFAANLLKKGFRDTVGDTVWGTVGDTVGANIRDNVMVNVGDNVGVNVWDNVGANVRDTVWDNVRNTVWNNVGENVGNNVRANVGNNVRANVGDNIGVNVRVNVRNNVGENVGNNVRANVWDNVGAEKLEWFNFSWYGNIADYSWVSFGDYFDRIGLKFIPEFYKFKELLETNIYEMIQFDNVCLVAELPSSIRRDSRGMLHCENAAAIRWDDGYELYYYHGVHVSDRIILHPETLTKEDIIREKNEEVRRVMIEKIGAEKFAKMMQFQIISEDDFGSLMMARIEDDVYIYAHVLCPSTGREYYLQVPATLEEALKALEGGTGETWEEWNETKERSLWPNSGKMETCKQACAWTFGKSEQDYNPFIQT